MGPSRNRRHGAGLLCCVLASTMCGRSPIAPAGALNGLYTLQIESNCAPFPADIRRRTYIASIEGGTVTLSGSTFWKHPTRGLLNTFGIQQAGDLVTLTLNQPGGPDIKGIVEETSPETYFGISGTGRGSVKRPAQTGTPQSLPTMEGTFAAGFGSGRNLIDDHEHVGCPAGGHTASFRFTPDATFFPPPGVATSAAKVSLEGPDSVAPSQTVQFVARVEMTDGSTREVSSVAQWSRSQFAVQLGSAGSLTGISIGESNVTASIPVPNYFAGLRATREVVVVPTGTVRIAGEVTTGFPAQPVANVQISVTSGPSTGLSTMTDWAGRYRLYGVSGTSEIRLSKNGYDEQVRVVPGTSHQTLNVTLPLPPIPNIAGSYTLTITSSQMCGSPIPDPLRVRTYSATIAQSGRIVNVVLGGVPFHVIDGRGNGFPGQIDPNQVVFELDDNDHFGIGLNPDVVERLSPSQMLGLFGRIAVGISADRLAGTFDGMFMFMTPAPLGGFYWGPECTSTTHQAVFTR